MKHWKQKKTTNIIEKKVKQLALLRRRGIVRGFQIKMVCDVYTQQALDVAK